MELRQYGVHTLLHKVPGTMEWYGIRPFSLVRRVPIDC